MAALQNNTTGSGNVALGYFSGNGVHTASGVISIGANGDDVDNSCYIGGIWQQSGGSQAVYANSQGKLGAQVSSRRFKHDIEPMEQSSEVIYRLNPVSFRYNAEVEPTCPVAFGLIAEDVEQVSPDLVARDKDGKPFSVRYDQVNAMLLNEFLKEHKKMLALEAQLAQQQKKFESKMSEQEKQIESLAAGLQQVNAQLKMSRSDLNVVATSQPF